LELKGSKTKQNIEAAFARTAIANVRYLYYAARAEAEGKSDVCALFRSTANKAAKLAHGHLEYMESDGDPSTGDANDTTVDHLKAALAVETSESADRYPAMAKVAREEELDEIADWFEVLADTEKAHADRFQKVLSSIKNRHAATTR